MEEQEVWNCIKAPLLLQMEKEMEDEVSLSATIELLLRRSVQLSVLCCTLASQFTQTPSLSRWKGRALQGSYPCPTDFNLILLRSGGADHLLL